MEIQDNNIMQLALNLSFDNKIQSAGDTSFLEMLTSPATSAPEASLKTADTAAVLKPKVKVKAPTGTAVASKPAKTAAPKETAPAPKAKPTKRAKPSAAETSGLAAPVTLDNQTAPAQNAAPVSSDTDTYVADIDTSSVEATVDVISSPLAPAIDATLDLVSEIDLAAQTVAASSEVLSNDAARPLETQMPEVLPAASDELVFSKGKKTDLELASPIDDNALPEEITSADDLLLQQSRYLDRKLNSDHPIKINVAAQEEKIAAPLSGNILQNSFELTSMLQKSSAETALPFAEPKRDSGDEPAALQTQNSLSDLPEVQLNTVAMAKTETLVQADLTKETPLSASGQLEAVSFSGSRSEVIAKNQDLNTDASLKGLGKEVVEQIKVNITKSAVKGVDTIDIELKPAELGKVQIRMYISKDGKLHADIIASRQETSDLLQREIEGLSKSFQDAGYDTDKQSFNFSFQEENQSQRHSESQRLQQFIGETLEQEAEAELANDNLIYDPAIGLNIRV